MNNLPYRLIGEGNAIALDPTGKTLAVSDVLNLYTYSVETNEVLQYFGTPDRHYDTIAYTVDGSQIIATGFGEGFEVWDAQTGSLRFTSDVPVVPPNSAEHRITLSPDGKYVGVSSAKDGIYIWETATWEQAAFLPATEFSSIFAFSPVDNGILATQNRRGEMTLYNWQTKEVIFADTVTGGFRKLWAIQFNKDGDKLAVAYTSGRILLATLDQALPKLLFSMNGHLAEVSQLLFVQDDEKLLSASWDETLILWDVKSGEPLRTYDRHQDQIYSVTVSPDHLTLYSASYDNSIYAWNLWMTEGTLRQWVERNRDVIIPDCEQLGIYKVPHLCE